MKATVTFEIVNITSLNIAGDTSSFFIGETRTFTATVAGTSPDAAGVVVQWNDVSMAGQTSPAFDVELAGNSVTVNAIAVGDLTLVARAGQAIAQLSCNVLASSIQITASSTYVRAGAAMAINAKAFGPGGVPCSIAGFAEMQVSDGGCLGNSGGGVAEADGSVTFMLHAGEGDCPSVTVTDVAIVSNAISFTVDKVASVVIQGPADPVTVDTMVMLRAVPLDAAGVPFDTGLFATWTDKSGIYMFTVTGALETWAMAYMPGTANIVATVNGVQSPPFVTQAVP
jgi:predicted RNA-binding protein with TRAM domain